MARIKEEFMQEKSEQFMNSINISLLQDRRQQDKLFKIGVDKIRKDLEEFEIKRLAAQATKDLVTKGFHVVQDV